MQQTVRATHNFFLYSEKHISHALRTVGGVRKDRVAREAEEAVREMLAWGYVWVEEQCGCGGNGGVMCACEGQGRIWCPRGPGMTPKASDRLIIDIVRREHERRGE